MPNILVLGAAGYIGLPLCLALLRTGNHTVYGLARNSARARLMSANEIIPIIGDAATPSEWAAALGDVSVDIVIDCSSAYEYATSLLNVVLVESRRRRALLTEDGFVGPKMGFISVSGTWVHGSPEGVLSDLTVPGSKLAKGTPAEVVAWRPAYEQLVLKASNELDVAVVRPAEVYGRNSWLFGVILTPLREAVNSGKSKVQLPLNEDSCPNIVHVDDVAEGLVKTVERLGLLGEWPVFDLITEKIGMKSLICKAAAILGYDGEITFVGSDGNVFIQPLNLKQFQDAQRARLVLGWLPRRMSILFHLQTMIRAWEASQVTES